MNILPDILYELNKDKCLFSGKEDYFEMLHEKKELFLDKFRGYNWFKYNSYEDLEGYSFSDLIHVINYVNNNINDENEEYLPEVIVNEENLCDYFNEYRYLMIRDMVLRNIDYVIEQYFIEYTKNAEYILDKEDSHQYPLNK